MNNDGGTTDIDERQLSMTDIKHISVHCQGIKTSTTASSFSVSDHKSLKCFFTSTGDSWRTRVKRCQGGGEQSR